MLINSAQKMPSIQRRISIEFRDPAHRLSINLLGSYLWRYLYRTEPSIGVEANKSGGNLLSLDTHVDSK